MSGKTGASQGLPIYNSCDYIATSTITLFISFIHYQRISEDFKKKIEFHEGVHWTSSSNVLRAQPVLLTGGGGGGGELLGILGRGVPPGSSNPDPISNQKCHFSHRFSDMASKIHTHSQTSL